MSEPEQRSAAVGCAMLLVIAGAIVWFGSTLLSGGDNAQEIKARQRDWPPSVMSAAEAFRSLGSADPANLTDEEMMARLNTCRELIRVTADKDFLTGVIFPDEDWDGSLGAIADLAGRGKMVSVRERVEAFRRGRPLEEQWLIFGVTDGFSGTSRTFRTGGCTAVGSSVWVEICADDGFSFCSTKVVSVD